MGISPVLVLAIALCAAFGAGGVLLGLWLGVRSITRDEERFALVAGGLETTRREMQLFKVEWSTHLEAMEQLAGAVEKGRRRAAASLSAADRKEQVEAANQAEQRPLNASEQRALIRRRMRGAA